MVDVEVTFDCLMVMQLNVIQLTRGDHVVPRLAGVVLQMIIANVKNAQIIEKQCLREMMDVVDRCSELLT